MGDMPNSRIDSCQKWHAKEVADLKKDTTVNKTRLGAMVAIMTMIAAAIANALGRWLIK